MTSFDTTPERLASGLSEIAGTSALDYHHDILRQVARTRQRPAWTFPERWIPMALVTHRARTGPPLRSAWTLLLIGLLILALVASLVIAGAVLLRQAPDDRLRGLATVPILKLDSTWDASTIPGLSMPSGMDVDANGNVYLVNAGADEILVLRSDGSVIDRWGSSGTEAGAFLFQRDVADPASAMGGVAVGRDGAVYVADAANRRVQQFDATGAFLRQWGGYGPADGQFLDPIDLGVGPDGSVYVVDDRRDDIQRFSADGAYIATIGGHGTGGGLLNNTGGVDVDAKGDVYNADYGSNRFQAWDQNGQFLWSRGGSGNGPGAFDLPSDVTVDGRGNIYVVEQHRVQAFGPDRSFLSDWAGPGTADADGLANLAVTPAGYVYIDAPVSGKIYRTRVVETVPSASTGPDTDGATAVAGSVAPATSPLSPDDMATKPVTFKDIFPVNLTVDMPESWVVANLSRGRIDLARPSPDAFVDLFVVANAYSGGCATHELSPQVGPSVDDLTEALTHLDGYRVGPVTDVTIDGFHGKAFDLDFALDTSDCDLGTTYQWTFDESSGGPVRNVPSFSAKTHQHIAILDVHGTRVLVEEWIFDMAGRDEVQEAYRVFDSIDFK